MNQNVIFTPKVNIYVNNPQFYSTRLKIVSSVGPFYFVGLGTIHSPKVGFSFESKANNGPPFDHGTTF